MGNYKKLTQNIVFIMAGSFASKLLSFLFVPFYTSILTTSEYGIADLITTTVYLLFPIFTGVISESMMRFALDKDINKSQVFMAGMLITFIGLALLIASIPLIRLYSILNPYIVYLLLYYVSFCLYSTFSYFVQGMQLIPLFTLSGVINTVVLVSLNFIFLLWLKIGLKGYLLSFIISGFISSISLFYGARLWQYRLPLRKIEKKILNEMLGYSLPMVPNSLSWWISNSASKYILTSYASIGVVGVFAAANKLPSIIYVLSGIFVSAWRLSAVDDFGTDRGIAFYSNVYNKYFALCVIASSLVVTFNKVLSFLFYGKDFYGAWQYIPILVLAVMMHGFSEFFGTIYTTAKRTPMLFYSSFIGAIVQIAAGWFLIQRYGGHGAAVSTLMSYAAIWAIRVIHSAKIIKLKDNYTKDIIQLSLLLAQVIIATFTPKFLDTGTFFILLAILAINAKLIINATKTCWDMCRARLAFLFTK